MDEMDADPRQNSEFSTIDKQKNKFCISEQEKRLAFLQDQKKKGLSLKYKNTQLWLQFEYFIGRSQENDIDEMICWETDNLKFRFTLMPTGWFTDVPEDLEDNWLVKCVPTGSRMVLICRRGSTILYDSKGTVVFKCKSNFPGGGGNTNPCATTIIDCIYHKDTRTIFILDCLCWNNMSLIHTKAEFRFLRLKNKFAEYPNLSHGKSYKFVLIDYIPAQRALIQNAMFEHLQVGSTSYYYDGVTFYHKESHYYFDETPLVGWLASYMLTEILNIDVSPDHLVGMPENYKNIHDYIQNESIMRENRKEKKV